MKKLLIGLMCVSGLANANALLKMRACNYTYADMQINIKNVQGISINNKDYPPFTVEAVDNQKLPFLHCQDIPPITLLNESTASFFNLNMGTSLNNPVVSAFSTYITVIDPNNGIVFDPKTTFPTGTVVFFHATNEWMHPTAYVNTTSIINAVPTNRVPLNYLYHSLNTQYDYEFYICDAAQLNPCNGNDVLNKMVWNMK